MQNTKDSARAVHGSACLESLLLGGDDKKVGTWSPLGLHETPASNKKNNLAVDLGSLRFLGPLEATDKSILA